MSESTLQRYDRTRGRYVRSSLVKKKNSRLKMLHHYLKHLDLLFERMWYDFQYLFRPTNRDAGFLMNLSGSSF